MQETSQHGPAQGDGANPSGQKEEQKKKPVVSWDAILLISCVIAVSGDPLFFYIPIINEEIKCLGVDKNVRIAALVLRSVTDIAFIWNIIYQIKKATGKVRQVRDRLKEKSDKDGSPFEAGTKIWFAKELAAKIPWRSIIIDILAVLPIPQVLMAVFFKLRSSKYLGNRKIVDVFLLVQYLPRVYRLHNSARKLRLKMGVWIRGAFYFFLYILSSHVLGAFWYFFSIQRETQCWHKACVKQSTYGCSFYCDQDVSSRNMTFFKNSLDEFCPVDVPANATAPFDFGIFLDSLKNGNTRQINFAKKFFYSFWWGLRNLSNFGTNLETSTYMLENCFAILISIIGLLLFLYLIGNVQTFISMESQQTEEKRKQTEEEKRKHTEEKRKQTEEEKRKQTEEKRKRLRSTEMDIEAWMAKNKLPPELKEGIKAIVKKNSEKIKDVDIKNLYNILPKTYRSTLKRHLCTKALREVRLPLKAMNNPVQENKEKENPVLTSILDHLRPVLYPDNSFIFRMGEPLDRMLLITEGVVWVYNTTSSSTSEDGEAGKGVISLGKGAYYGEELVSWASGSLDSLGNVPLLKENVKCHTKVEGFVLRAKDLKAVVGDHKMYWDFPDSKNRKLAAIQTLQNAVRRQRTMRPKRDQQKVQQPENSKAPDVPPTSAVMVPLPETVVVDVRSEDTTAASSQVP